MWSALGILVLFIVVGSFFQSMEDASKERKKKEVEKKKKEESDKWLQEQYAEIDARNAAHDAAHEDKFGWKKNL
jgi:choline-glycine betaine transporter